MNLKEKTIINFLHDYFVPTISELLRSIEPVALGGDYNITIDNTENIVKYSACHDSTAMMCFCKSCNYLVYTINNLTLIITKILKLSPLKPVDLSHK